MADILSIQNQDTDLSQSGAECWGQKVKRVNSIGLGGGGGGGEVTLPK